MSFLTLWVYYGPQDKVTRSALFDSSPRWTSLRSRWWDMLQWITANVPPLRLPPDGALSLYFDPKRRQLDPVIGDPPDGVVGPDCEGSGAKKSARNRFLGNLARTELS